MTDGGKPQGQPAAPESKPASSHSSPAGAEAKSDPKPTPAEPKPASVKEEKVSAPKQNEKPPQAVPERGKTHEQRAREEMSELTSASTLQEYRVPGVQYPASSNQLPENWDAEENLTPVQLAERQQAEAVAKLNEGSADLLVAAGSSGDAGLQQLLAARTVAEQNQDEVGINSVDRKLSELLGK